MKIAVVGAGAMGRWAVKELGHQPRGRARSWSATTTRSRRAPWPPRMAATRRAPCSSTRATWRASSSAIAGCDAMVNATQHFWNITVMHAAAAAGVHYTDMGGLFHVTKQQVELDAEFKKAGVTAVIAMGGAPGVTNILARYGAERLDTVEEAQALCGNVDDTDWSRYDGWVVPYSLETLCDEFSVTAPEFIDGAWNMDITGGRGRRGHRLRRARRHPRGALHHPLRALHLLAHLEGQGPEEGDLQAVAARGVHRADALPQPHRHDAHRRGRDRRLPGAAARRAAQGRQPDPQAGRRRAGRRRLPARRGARHQGRAPARVARARRRCRRTRSTAPAAATSTPASRRRSSPR